jgi:hypothetical protein
MNTYSGPVYYVFASPRPQIMFTPEYWDLTLMNRWNDKPPIWTRGFFTKIDIVANPNLPRKVIYKQAVLFPICVCFPKGNIQEWVIIPFYRDLLVHPLNILKVTQSSRSSRDFIELLQPMDRWKQAFPCRKAMVCPPKNMGHLSPK